MKYNNVFSSYQSLFNLLLFKTKKIKKTLSNFVKSTLLCIISSASWASYTLNMDPGVSEISRRTYGLHMTIFWICVAIGVVVFGILIYSLIMHRRSRGHQAHDFHENTAVEIIWTIIPFVILIAMAIPATSVLKFIDDKSNSDVLVKITGFQWRWQYEFPEHDISYFSNLTTPQEQIDNQDTKDSNYLRSVDNPLVLPVGKKIRFLFTANDVIHSWWVPKLGIKKDAIPGFINESWVVIDTPGTYYGQCAELCGARHGYMPIVVEAKTEAEYQAWITEQKAKPKPVEIHSAGPVPTTPATDETSKEKEASEETDNTKTESTPAAEKSETLQQSETTPSADVESLQQKSTENSTTATESTPATTPEVQDSTSLDEKP